MLELLTADPPNAGTPISSQDGRLLDQGEVYMRNNFAIPAPEDVPAEIDIVMPGEAPRRLSVDRLRAMDSQEVAIVLECAGNGRTLMEPAPGGTPWSLNGASSTSIAGIPLAAVAGGLPEEVVELVFTGSDSGPVHPEGEVNYQFSLDRELALSGAPMLALDMAGEPLSLEHGGPVRLVVPGHYAMKSVKWLRSIEGVTEPFHGHFVSKYRYFDDAQFSEGAPVGAQLVRSVIAAPSEGDTLASGTVRVQGSAWGGATAIATVELSIDGGRTWAAAQMGTGKGAYGPTPWTWSFEGGPGAYEITCLATDVKGRSQPLRPRWNRNGYANNVAHRVRVTIT